jgi:hypothetical protein
MPGHIDEAEALAGGQSGVRVTQIERDAARLLFRQAVCIHAGERLDQRRLAVVDMACRADDHGRREARGASARREGRQLGEEGVPVVQTAQV